MAPPAPVVVSKDRHMERSISDAIRELRTEYIADKKVTTYYAINNGDCEDFGEEIVSLLDRSSIFTVCGENFYRDAGGGDENWDQKLLAEYWHMSPPEHLTWEMLDEIPFGGHVWVTDGKRHYDAECPDGVDSFFDLPIFRRSIVTYLRQSGIACKDVETEDVKPAPLCPVPNPTKTKRYLKP